MEGAAPTGQIDSPAPDDKALQRDLDAALVSIRARVRGHAGDVVVAGVRDGVVALDFQGACRGCPAQVFTFLAVVEPALAAVPGVRLVEPPRAVSSPVVRQRILRMLASSRSGRRSDAAV